MPPTEHSGNTLRTESTTTTAYGDPEIQHVAASGTQDDFF